MTISPNVGLNFTEFEQDIDLRTREWFDNYLPWGIEHYDLKQMQYLYECFWKQYFEEGD